MSEHAAFTPGVMVCSNCRELFPSCFIRLDTYCTLLVHHFFLHLLHSYDYKSWFPIVTLKWFDDQDTEWVHDSKYYISLSERHWWVVSLSKNIFDIYPLTLTWLFQNDKKKQRLDNLAAPIKVLEFQHWCANGKWDEMKGQTSTCSPLGQYNF